MEPTIPEQVIREIEKYPNVVLLTHTHPDGDALGSLLGFRTILQSLGKDVFCYLEEKVSHLYEFLPGADTANTSLEQYQEFVQQRRGRVLTIALDCGDDDRLGTSKDLFLHLEPFIVIDHHSSHRNFGNFRWVAPDCSSTGEMVYELAVVLGADVSYECSFCLYVAICTDTGSFRYESTSARTMHIAGALLAKGVKPEEVGGYLYDNYSRQRLRLLELVLSTITLSVDDQVAFIHVSEQMLEESGASSKDVEGFIDFPRSLGSVKVAVFLKETSGGTIAVSLRAKGACDVADIAKSFKGGGHRNAAGFKWHGRTLEQTRVAVEAKLKDVLAGVGSSN